jgi:membrane-associated phospholipid phosphatase
MEYLTNHGCPYMEALHQLSSIPVLLAVTIATVLSLLMRKRILLFEIVCMHSAYFAGRYSRIWWVPTALAVMAIAACLLIGISDIYRGSHYPSDVTAAYAFGGVWISSVVVVMELYRLLQIKRASARKEV